jgi:polysaccharide pyruvyl transferase WcaK-like protein
MPKVDKPYVAVLGAALSANKGAASMLLALVDNIEAVVPGGTVVSLSTYGAADRRENHNPRLSIVDYPPLTMAVLHFPLALLAGLSRLFGASGAFFARTRALRTLREASVVADLAGISFSDGRGLPTLVYNALMTGIPLLLGRPVVKCSQALGPFEENLTKAGARLVLPRLKAIVARGPGTYEHLISLGLDNVVPGADLAFIMEVGEGEQQAVHELLAGLEGRPYFVISPSSVVEALCNREDIDYVALMADLVGRLVDETGLVAVMVAHSARTGQPKGRMNDLPVVREVAARVGTRSEILLIDESLDPRVLRALIGGSRFLLASRFHAMISGLATETPTVVVGWSHKYREVMGEFGLADYVVQFSGFNVETLFALSIEANDKRDRISLEISEALPAVLDSSRTSLERLRKAINA